jgi:hypothetical protein
MYANEESASRASETYEWVPYEPQLQKGPKNRVNMVPDTVAESQFDVHEPTPPILDAIALPKPRPQVMPKLPKPDTNPWPLRPLTGYFLALNNVVNRPRDGEKCKVQVSQRLQDHRGGVNSLVCKCSQPNARPNTRPNE